MFTKNAKINNESFKFKKDYQDDKRRQEANKIKQKYPLRIPVIVEKYQSATNLPELNQNRFLFQGLYTYGEFQALIRERLQLPKEQAIFIFFPNNKLYNHTTTLAHIFDECKDEDGFLYAVYSAENVYG